MRRIREWQADVESSVEALCGATIKLLNRLIEVSTPNTPSGVSGGSLAHQVESQVEELLATLPLSLHSSGAGALKAQVQKLQDYSTMKQREECARSLLLLHTKILAKQGHIVVPTSPPPEVIECIGHVEARSVVEGFFTTSSGGSALLEEALDSRSHKSDATVVKFMSKSENLDLLGYVLGARLSRYESVVTRAISDGYRGCGISQRAYKDVLHSHVGELLKTVIGINPFPTYYKMQKLNAHQTTEQIGRLGIVVTSVPNNTCTSTS